MQILIKLSPTKYVSIKANNFSDAIAIKEKLFADTKDKHSNPNTKQNKS